MLFCCSGLPTAAKKRPTESGFRNGEATSWGSYDGFGRGVQLTTTSHGPRDYHEIVEDLDTDLDRPHFGQYEWEAPDAEQTNGYAAHAEFYARMAQNHPSIVAYSMSHNATGKLLEGMGVRCQPVGANADVSAYDTLIVGKSALTVDGPAPDVACVRDGLKVIMFEQTSEVLEKRFGFRVTEYGLRWVFQRVPDHPLPAGIAGENLRNWRGEATIVPPRRDAGSNPQEYPQVRWSGIKLPRAWRAGCQGNVASVLIEKPAAGDFLPIVDGGFNLQYAPLLECREGKGVILFCQMDVTGRTEDDPAATRLARNILAYASAYSPPQRRTALYVGDPAGRTHFERAGVSLGNYPGGALTIDQVLVVGTGGAARLAPHKDAIASWLKAGGHLLAVGLNEADANAFLPFEVGMNEQEHMASFFEPLGNDSLLAGVGPADVHNRDPRELSLVSKGASVVGDGVLAVGENANVVWRSLIEYQYFSPDEEWRQFTFLAQSKDTADTKTRFQVWHGNASTVWFADMRIVPCEPPTQGRWLTGLYLDTPTEMHDPYRFFRW